jgi:hypothetical protein
VPIGYTHPHSYGITDCDSYSDSDSHACTYSHTYTYTHSNGTTDANSYADANANPDCDAHRYAGPNHTQRAWLQSAGFADGGPLMGRRDLKQH